MLRRVVRSAALAAISLALGTPALVAQTVTPSVSLGGVGYAQYEYLLSDDANRNNFDVTRAYLTATGAFSRGIGVRITTDIYNNSDAQKGVRLKYAYASWRPTRSRVGFRFGLTQTPWLSWEEALWDYRMQGPMALDRNGYLVSSDYGLAVDGSWRGEALNLQGGIYNGEGYNQPLGDRRKDISARLSIRALPTSDISAVGGLRFTGYGQIGSPNGGGTRNRFIGMISYRDTTLTIAGELALTRDRDSLATASTHGRVVSTFAVVKIPATAAAVIGRVDLVDPDTRAGSDRRTEFILGASYRLSPNLRVLLDVDNLSYQGSFPSSDAEAQRTRGLFQIEIVF